MQRDLTEIIAAIKSRQTIKLVYAPGERLIEPHAIGYGSQGQILLRAYQVSGASASGEHEHWKLFRLDRTKIVDGGGSSFNGPRPEYKTGDRAMKGGIIAELK